jgi:hypothetical protein
MADDVIAQVLRGSSDQASVIGPHGLLEDLYGNGYTEGTIIDTSPIVGELFLLQTDVADPYKHIGCVLTMTSGPCKGLSTRIVGCDNSTFAPSVCFQVLLSNPALQPAATDTFIINGTPFSGTGFGYENNLAAAVTDPLLTANDPTTGQPYALLPNPRAFTPDGGTYTDPAGPGGANEDYDAADYQNMLLASVVPQSGTPNVVIPIPSLHRPSLVNYWFHQLANDATFPWPATPPGLSPEDFRRWIFLYPYGFDGEMPTADDWTNAPYNMLPAAVNRIVDLKRRILLRPCPEDHPNFTGSNPNFYPLWDGNQNPVWIDKDLDGNPVPGERFQAQWDIDNDGDGIMDSIWVDVGLPVRTMRDGRQYKPLAAILCVDMDGRLNLNAHGCLAQVELDPSTVTLPGNIAAGGSNILTNIPHGQGMGPVEIRLDKLLGPLSCFGLLRGIDVNTVGRYGTFEIMGTPPPSAGVPGLDPLSANQWFAYPDIYDKATTLGTQSYGTPLDMHGSVTIGLDLRGQPLYYPTDSFFPYAGQQVDNPYELNLSNVGRGVTRTLAADTPFTVNELEAVLRPYDMDASTLPGRLTQLATDLKNHRHEVTTESWSLPCPAIVMPPELRPSLDKASSFRDLLRAKVPTMNADTMRQLVGPELLSGLKLNLNRPFGNGMDNNGNGVIDEPGEAEAFYQVGSDGTALAPTLFDLVQNTDVNNDALVDASDQAFASQHSMARQLHARHLYVMMLLLIHHDGIDQDVAREVAQWAVNIVDFRDRDSIMTGFEYDVSPFTDDNAGIVGTWDVDSDPTTDDNMTDPHIVWGCERPELLITETLAFHDRRTEDESTGPSEEYTANHIPPGTDDDFDQRVRPEGSLFVELYNPWTDNESLPGELYRTIGVHTGIDLRAKDVVGADSPVWRLIIVEKAHPEDPDAPNLPGAWEIERSIYFVEPGPVFAAAVTDDGERYYPDSANLPDISLLKPGRYAVVGPGYGNGSRNGSPGEYETYVGFLGDPLAPAQILAPESYNDTATRRIVLTPSANPDTKQVAVHGDGLLANDDLALDIQLPIAVVINPPDYAANQPKRLSVSEPCELADRYPAAVNGVYATARDEPLDTAYSSVNMTNGTTSQHRWLYLQRLANPLEAYDEETNPYRTIDKAQVDLTAFNGLNPDSTDTTVTSGTYQFFTRERGEDEEDVAGPAGKPHDIWAVELASAAPTADVPVANTNKQPPAQSHYFGEDFAHTLGYLNEGFGVPQLDPRSPADTTYNGSPLEPFPWFTWLNRPFLSEMEMMLVPKRRSSQLLAEFTMTAGNTYTTAAEPYGHVINFFYDDATFPVTSTPHWKLHRLLEFVRVPSPFVGTELQGEPTRFSDLTKIHDFHTPFNRISNRRDPGRVNLNTITSQNVWNGLVGDFVDPAAPTPLWNDFIRSRRGNNNTNMFALDPDVPTRFANPFRSFAGRYLVPDTAQSNPPKALQVLIGPNETDATLLRPVPGSAPPTPLFNYDPTVDNPVNNTDRNPYFRYQLLNRMGSTATTRSNVYAVWVTVGYFEVEPVTWSPVLPGPPPVDARGLTHAQFQQIYPDGFQLGQELGSDTGDITRHRAFYMIDRSIPVGFKRGEDLNTENAILLRRFIE